MAENGGRIQRQRGFSDALDLMGRALGISKAAFLGHLVQAWLYWTQHGAFRSVLDLEIAAGWANPSGALYERMRAGGVLYGALSLAQMDIDPEWDAALTALFNDAVAIRRKATREAKEKRITRCEVHSSKLTPDSVEVMQIPIKGALRVAFVMSDFAEEMEEIYPEVDIQRELAKARQWCVSKPDRQKTRRGVRAFLVAWMDRAQESAARKTSSDWR